MSVVVEINTPAGGDLRSFRATLSRVPVVGEVVRTLHTFNGATSEMRFKVLGVVHVGNTEAYPERPASVHAWLDCGFES